MPSKLDVFLWLTVKCHSEVPRSSYQRCSIRTPFLQNTSRRLLLSFYKKIFTNVKNVRQTKVQKVFIYREKKESLEQRETNSNASYYNWRPGSDWWDGILNATLPEKVSTTGVIQENLELPLLPNSLDSHQTQNNEIKFWTDPRFYSLEGELANWVDKAKSVWLIVGSCP